MHTTQPSIRASQRQIKPDGGSTHRLGSEDYRQTELQHPEAFKVGRTAALLYVSGCDCRCMVKVTLNRKEGLSGSGIV